MKEALYYKKINGKVTCLLCPRKCLILEGKKGFCNVRQNMGGKLYSLVYGKACSANIDPIEKKPLFHFIPGHSSFSISTVGCNLACKHCQNYEISQATIIFGQELSPEDIVRLAKRGNCKSIAYTYTEPTIFYEYALDTAKLAKKERIKNVIVSNGFINEEPLKEFCKYIDGANIDLKGFDDNFYRKITTAWLDPVLNTLKILKKNKVWLEVTNLIIPTLNDDPEKIKEMCVWVKDNLGKDVPFHFSRFYPYYKLSDLYPTPPETLIKAKKIVEDVGLNYVYIGNLPTEDGENTYCPKCKELVIERRGYTIVQNNIKDGKCGCGEEIEGVWR